MATKIGISWLFQCNIEILTLYLKKIIYVSPFLEFWHPIGSKLFEHALVEKPDLRWMPGQDPLSPSVIRSQVWVLGIFHPILYRVYSSPVRDIYQCSFARGKECRYFDILMVTQGVPNIYVHIPWCKSAVWDGCRTKGYSGMGWVGNLRAGLYLEHLLC